MTILRDERGIVVPADDAEVLGLPNNVTRLLAEGKDTAGAFSAIRASLAPGADGARPHHHAKASELFFVIEGSVDILVGEEVITANTGDLAVVAPMAKHAFANASKNTPVDLLIVFGPGIERFDYFRLLQDVVAGKKNGEEILATQERFDNWFSDSPAWTAHHSRRQVQ
ncbi:MAG TPA: cupin domain-containing protein [Dehalococcoidia bacterium]